jgi:L-fuculose-phosphate aldolase
MKGFLEPHHVARIDMRGRRRSTRGPRASSGEGASTWPSYQERPEMQRGRPRAPAPRGRDDDRRHRPASSPSFPEIIVTIGGIPTAPFGTPGTQELARVDSRNILKCSDTVDHDEPRLGDASGTNLLDAYKKLDMVEHTAKILWLAHTVGAKLEPLDPDKVKKLLATRAALGVSTVNTLENSCAVTRRTDRP